MGIALLPSMVVEQIDIEGIASLEAEDDAPVGGYVDRPKALQLALERVEPEAWGIHVGHGRRDVQAAQDTADLGHMLQAGCGCDHPARRGASAPNAGSSGSRES